jgi:hypothetical protein
MTRRTVLALPLLVIAVLGIVLAAVFLPADAQEMIRLTGWVQWVSGARMQIMSDGYGSVAIDLRDADQSSYQGLRAGDYVVVDGVVSSDRSRVIARQILRDGGTWLQAP